MKKIIFLIPIMILSIFVDSKNIRFAVISDTHLYDTTLGVNSEEFKKYVENDRKLLEESSFLFDQFLEDIQNESLDFVLVPGDITKDGELLNHKFFIEKISKILDGKTKVFVICGNHDINNFDGFKYEEKGKERVESISKKDFENLYQNFGYLNYFSKDENSLSYITSLNEEYYLVALDGCKYFLNNEKNPSTVSGKVNKKTLFWLKDNLEKLKGRNKKVIVMIHHNLIEHFAGQKKGYPEYVLENNEELLKILKRYDVKLVFTGHFHANDIAKRKFKNGYIFEIETGSPSTFPSPYRIVEILNDTFVKIQTFSLLKTPELYSYAKEYTESGIYNIAFKIIKGYKISDRESDILAKKISYSMVSHYRGDEVMPEGFFETKGFSLKSKFIMFLKKDMFKNLLNDSTPDNDVIINLYSGEISNLK
ncbi:MAG: metallophosphoesterase [bacterium]|uniref:Serine/threonine protein phosphatase n=1 Tax=candidate division TA06 bacterium 34_109 TaxID=1635277 RepID=A0A101HZN3_UNCT6|nr:MAG: Serine/threonine protein phosphatase [candidate division TA06 bacterium 32_111]KUK86331.1 MAG: Serine/threonine protein phosphatase [candidate division TA06 bacterium 34_109]MDI6699873.1 metallophosphoesterase [bacterium]